MPKRDKGKGREREREKEREEGDVHSASSDVRGCLMGGETFGGKRKRVCLK